MTGGPRRAAAARGIAVDTVAPAPAGRGRDGRFWGSPPSEVSTTNGADGSPEPTARRLRRRRGNGVLEACFVLPVLLYLSMGMVEFGQFLYVKHSIQAASRDGARTAILGTATHQKARDAVASTMTAAGMSDATKYSVKFHNTATNPATEITNIATVAKGTSIRVTVTATAGNVSVRPLGVIPAAKAITGVTTMIKE